MSLVYTDIIDSIITLSYQNSALSPDPWPYPWRCRSLATSLRTWVAFWVADFWRLQGEEVEASVLNLTAKIFVLGKLELNYKVCDILTTTKSSTYPFRKRGDSGSISHFLLRCCCASCRWCSCSCRFCCCCCCNIQPYPCSLALVSRPYQRVSEIKHFVSVKHDLQELLGNREPFGIAYVVVWSSIVEVVAGVGLSLFFGSSAAVALFLLRLLLRLPVLLSFVRSVSKWFTMQIYYFLLVSSLIVLGPLLLLLLVSLVILVARAREEMLPFPFRPLLFPLCPFLSTDFFPAMKQHCIYLSSCVPY